MCVVEVFEGHEEAPTEGVVGLRARRRGGDLAIRWIGSAEIRLRTFAVSSRQNTHWVKGYGLSCGGTKRREADIGSGGHAVGMVDAGLIEKPEETEAKVRLQNGWGMGPGDGPQAEREVDPVGYRYRARSFQLWASINCRRRALTVVSILALCTGLAAQNASQPSQLPKTAPASQAILNSYESQNVTSVEIAGSPNLDTSKLLPLLQQHAGEPFSRQKVDESIAALKSAGKFSEVQLQVDPEANGVRVLMIVEPAVWFGIFEFPGAERFPYSKLVQIANYPPQSPFNTGDVQRDSDALLRFFQQEGYFEAEVRPEVDLDTTHNLANVRFMVSLNRRAKFGTVSLPIPHRKRRSNMSKSLQGVRARARGAAIRPGKTYRRGH